MESHPVRVRGLKPLPVGTTGLGWESHPVRVRGLKLIPQTGIPGADQVAPRAGAWIETQYPSESIKPLRSRTPCGCVD